MAFTETESAPARSRAPDDHARYGIAWVHPMEQVTLLGARSVVIGRGEGADLVLKSSLVSRVHARIHPSRLGPVIEDAGSKNGVRLNGERVGDALISLQDVVRIGDWVGVYCQLDPSSSPTDAVVRRLSERIFGSFPLQRVYEQLIQVAPGDVPVVLVGETGTGKELFATALHARSGKSGKLIAVNCAALPHQLAEAELFGHRKGAFSGAEQARSGHFREAHDGTLFLDEIADLDLALQPKLLRAIEERAVMPLGQSTPVPASARIVSAAQRPLSAAVESGAFRPDLYARLHGIVLCLPALRQRREEVLFQFRRAWAEGDPAKLEVSADVAEQLCLYAWPGNLREVVQVARRARALSKQSDDAVFGLDKLPEHIATYDRLTKDTSDLYPQGARHCLVEDAVSPPSDAPNSFREGANASVSRRTNDSPRNELAQRVAEELRRAGGNVSRAAQQLGISRSMAYRLMRRIPEVEPEQLRLQRFSPKRPSSDVE